MSHERRCLLVGHYGRGNAGDAAMLEGALVAIRRAGMSPLVATEDATELPDLEYVPLKSLRVLRETWRARMLVLGGGTHFHDDFRGWRHLIHVRYMLFFTALALLARIRGIPAVWLSVGIGPIRRASTRLILRMGLWACRAVTVRDDASRADAERARPGEYAVVGDLAVLLDLPSAPPVRGRVGISLTTMAESAHGLPGPADPFWDTLRATLASALRSTPASRLRFLVFSTGPREPDDLLTDAMLRTLTPEFGPRVERVAFTGDIRSFLRATQECEVLVASRYHSLVLGYAMGCRVVALAYQRKLADFGKEIGLPPGEVLHLWSPADRSRIPAKVAAVVSGGTPAAALVPPADYRSRSEVNVEILRGLA